MDLLFNRRTSYEICGVYWGDTGSRGVWLMKCLPCETVWGKAGPLEYSPDLWAKSRLQWDSEMQEAPMSDLSSQACSRRLRLPLWSTPAIQGTTHRDLASKGTYLDSLSFGVERTLEFTKCNPLHISDMTAQVETFGFSRMESFPFASSISMLLLLDANSSLSRWPYSRHGTAAFELAHRVGRNRHFGLNKFSRIAPWVTLSLTIYSEVSLGPVLQKQHYLEDCILYLLPCKSPPNLVP